MTLEQDVARLAHQVAAWEREGAPRHAERHRLSGSDPVVAGHQVMGGNLGGNVAGAGLTVYASPLGGSTVGTTESQFSTVMPFAGVLRRLYVITSTAQPGTGSLVVTLRVESGATNLTTTIAAGGAAGTYSDLVNTARVNPGDRVSLQFVNNASGNSAALRGWSLELMAR